MYIIEHPTKGILVEEPTPYKKNGTWSWAKGRSEALILNTKQAYLAYASLPRKVQQDAYILEYGTWKPCVRIQGELQPLDEQV